MDWSEMPSLEDVEAALRKRAALRAALRVAELTLDILRAEQAQLKPRDASAKIIGTDAESREALIAAQRAVLDTKSELDDVEATMDLLNYRKDMAKVASFRMRA